MPTIQLKSNDDQVYTYNNKTVGDYEVSDTGIERIVKVDGMGGYTSTLVMSKEAFIEAYEKYIKQSREETVDEEIKVDNEVLEQEPKTGYLIDTGSGEECSKKISHCRPMWIPISEKLPEDGETVIASTKYGVYPEARYTKEDGWKWAYESGADYWVELDAVMAWMPLPTKYKPQESEG